MGSLFGRWTHAMTVLLCVGMVRFVMQIVLSKNECYDLPEWTRGDKSILEILLFYSHIVTT